LDGDLIEAGFAGLLRMPPRWISAAKQGLNMNGIVNGRGKGWPGKQGAWRVVLLLVLLSQTIMGCQAEEAGQEPVAVEVMRVGFDRTTDMPVVILRDKGETRAIPIWIGAFEARAIAMELEGAAAPRPLTHDLLKSILQGAGVVFEKVLVSELKERTYYARIFLTSAGKDFEVDSRPSDAIALALRFRKPILVARSLMEGDTALDLEDLSEPVVESVRGITVQEISQGLAASLGLDSKEGVLVSNVGGSGNAGLKRGDVILAVGSEPVTGVGGFQSILSGLKGQSVRLRVRRDGKEQVIELPPQP
jgi:bifunctional DNase/RNase